MTKDFNTGKLNVHIMTENDLKTINPDLSDMYFVEDEIDTRTMFSRVNGSITSSTTTIDLGVNIDTIDQILYININEAILLPSSYTLNDDKHTLTFNRTLNEGSEYSILYVK